MPQTTRYLVYIMTEEVVGLKTIKQLHEDLGTSEFNSAVEESVVQVALSKNLET